MRLLLVVLCFLAVPGLHAQAPQSDALRVELMFWESVRSSTDPADFRAYLEKYPQGQFAPLARNRLNALSAQPAPSAAPPAAPQASAPPPPPVRAGPPVAGDTWTYRQMDTRRGVQIGAQEVTIVSATPDTIVEDLRTSDGKIVRSEYGSGAYLAPAGDLTVFSPYYGAWGAQAAKMRIGNIDNRDPRTCKAGWTCSARSRLLGMERIRVPAGVFDTHKVEVQQRWQAPSQTNDRGEAVSRIITAWYAPDVKRIVRMTSRGDSSNWVETNYEVELVSYQLKP